MQEPVLATSSSDLHAPRPVTWPGRPNSRIIDTSPIHRPSSQQSMSPSSTSWGGDLTSPENRFAPKKGILKNVSFQIMDANTRGSSQSSQRSVSTRSSGETETTSNSGSRRHSSRSKDLDSRLDELRKETSSQEAQIQHYLRLAVRPGVSFEEQTSAMDKARQLRAHQAARNR
jgi:hypothetical protein